MPLDPPAGFNEPQASESTPTESVDIDPDNVVLVQSQDQGIQVNLPKEGVDVGCQFHAKGEQLMMKSAYTQTEFTLHIPHLCTTSTQTSPFKRKIHLARWLWNQSAQRSHHKRMLLTSHQHWNVSPMIPMYQDLKMRRNKN